jgi:molecular chaperone HtpG
MRNKNEIKDEEYTEFYKFQANAFDEPNYRMHFSSDAPIEINALVFVPKLNPEQLGFGKVDPGVSLYCKKILIDSKPEGLLPDWMRFLKGVVDSADLPLNISREKMQDSALANKIGQVITGRFIKLLEEESKNDQEKYKEFYQNFSIFIKEGVAADFKNRDQLAKLLRYESSATEKGEFTTLDDYVSRMKEEQKEIYYLYAPNRETIDGGPHLEAFKARGIEVLYLYEPVDEFVMTSLAKYADKDLVSADNSDIELEEVTSDKKKDLMSDDEAKTLCEWIKETLGDSVNDVSVSKRLVDSPAITLNADKVMTPSMRRMMKAMKQDVNMQNSVNLEINPGHELIKNLAGLKDKDPDTAKLVTEQILDNALIAAGYLEDPREMVSRIYKILELVTEK